METSQTLAIESFSYSWLSTSRPSLDGLDDESLRASIDSSNGGDMDVFDYKMVQSNRFLMESQSQSFGFDIPITQSPAAFVHADELFSNGIIRPVFIEPPKREVSNTQESIQTIPRSFSSRGMIPSLGMHCGLLRSWRKSTHRFLRNLFGYLRPFCHRVGYHRKSTRVDDIDRRVWQVKSWSNSPQASPQRTVPSVGDLREQECSIYEAILHCKRSIEN